MALGLSDAAFLELTPRLYHLLLQREMERQRHEEWCAGVVAATVANWSMGAPEKPLRPWDFALPLLAEPKAQRARINRKAIAEQVRGAFTSVMGGR